jgi:integrase
MPTVALTDISVKNLPAPTSGQVTHWDESLSSFGVRVSQGGTKTFVVVHGVERRRFTIGRYPVISLKQARDKAKELQAGLTLGLVEKRPSPAYVDALKLFLEACTSKNRKRTVDDYRRLLSRHFAFGQKRLSDITRADIQARLDKLKHLPGEQRHALVTLKVFFNWVVREEYVSQSPIATMRSPTGQVARERVLTVDELAEVYQKAIAHPWPFGPIVQLLVLTGQRRSEIAALRWSWMNRGERLITWPADFTKNRRTHTLPYGDMVASIIDNLPLRKGKDFVFPGRTEKSQHFNGWGKCKAQFDTKLVGVDPYVLHDLRRTYSSTMAQLGTPIHVTEKLLNHVSGTISGVAAIYNRHSYLAEMRAAVSDYDNYLTGLCEQYVISSGNDSA